MPQGSGTSTAQSSNLFNQYNQDCSSTAHLLAQILLTNYIYHFKWVTLIDVD